MRFWCTAICLFFSTSFCYGFETVTVPSGQLIPFWLEPSSNGQKTNGKTKPIIVSSFEAMKYPVTVALYKKFLKDHEKWKKKNVPSLFADEAYLKNEIKDLSPNTPITEISWFAARAFCEAYHMRLPTINEWEYMAAASEKKVDANKDKKFLNRILNWYGEPHGKKLKPVGSIYKNIYGIWDLHGLIWEWVEDFNSSFVTGESREDSSFNKNMFCGSGAISNANKENYAAFMRFAFRSSLKANNSVWNLGFRCVR